MLHRVGNGGYCGCETVSREVLPQVEIPEKWTQEPPCFAITIWCAIKIAHQLELSGGMRHDLQLVNITGLWLVALNIGLLLVAMHCVFAWPMRISPGFAKATDSPLAQPKRQTNTACCQSYARRLWKSLSVTVVSVVEHLISLASPWFIQLIVQAHNYRNV